MFLMRVSYGNTLAGAQRERLRATSSLERRDQRIKRGLGIDCPFKRHISISDHDANVLESPGGHPHLPRDPAGDRFVVNGPSLNLLPEALAR
jgi:hypothetical protein